MLWCVICSVRCIGQAIDSLKWIYCLTNYPLWGFSPKVRYPNRNFHAKNWTSQRGARGVVHGKSIFYYFSIGMYRKTLKNGVFGLKYDLDHPKSIFYRKKVLCALLRTYSITFQDISFFDPPYRGVAGAISGADFAKKQHFWVNLRLEWPKLGFQTQTNGFMN